MADDDMPSLVVDYDMAGDDILSMEDLEDSRTQWRGTRWRQMCLPSNQGTLGFSRALASTELVADEAFEEAPDEATDAAQDQPVHQKPIYELLGAQAEPGPGPSKPEKGNDRA